MNQIQITEQVKDLTLADKMHLIAHTLRNCIDIKQGKGVYYSSEKDTFCAMGALAFRAGISKHDLKDNVHSFGFSGALDLYGIDRDTRANMPLKMTPTEKNRHIGGANLSSLWYLNDHGFSFNEIADIVDRTADAL